MKINIVVYERGWILESIAKSWLENLKKLNFQVSLSYDYPKVVEDCIYIHFIWFNACIVPGALNICYVTHMDSYWKIFKLVKLARKNVRFICMSSETKDLISKYTNSLISAYCIPKSLHFGEIKKFKITLGFFSRLQVDGRKNFLALRKLIDLAEKFPEKFSLIFYGDNYELLKIKKSENIIVINSKFDAEEYHYYLRQCDYVVYLSFDEGAMSILDSATLGIPVLATNQGYHKDLQLPLGSFLFNDSIDIIRYLEDIYCHDHTHSNNLPDIIRNLDFPLKSQISLIKYFSLFFVHNNFISKSRKNLFLDFKFILKIMIGKL